MHRAIVHIGTEKTGSTSIQNFLYKNETTLAQFGYYFPFRTCGLISNFRLVLYTLEQPDPGLIALARKSFPDELTGNYFNEWKEEFLSTHLMALEKIRSIHENSTVVYSSEHFHSRISSEKEIETLREYLESHYDQVEIIGYFRRQDRLAISGHNTAIQGGAAHSFNFSHLNGVTKYYDYLSLMTMWSNVFGVDRVSVNVYERDRLIGNDIGHDFKAKIFPPKLLARLEERELHFERSNPRLSYSALNTLLEFNKTKPDDSVFQGVDKASLRQPLIAALHSLKDGFGEMLPARNEAVDFYEHFIDDNRALFEKFGITEGFTDDFSMYPDENHEAPVINVKALLTDYVTRALQSQA